MKKSDMKKLRDCVVYLRKFSKEKAKKAFNHGNDFDSYLWFDGVVTATTLILEKIDFFLDSDLK